MCSIFYTVSKFKNRNLNSFFHLLSLLSGNISQNPEPAHQDKQQFLNEWNVFKTGLQFIYLTMNFLLRLVINYISISYPLQPVDYISVIIKCGSI